MVAVLGSKVVSGLKDGERTEAPDAPSLPRGAWREERRTRSDFRELPEADGATREATSSPPLPSIRGAGGPDRDAFRVRRSG